MSLKHTILIVGIAMAMPSLAYAQGTVPDAERGAHEGGEAAGSVGAIVGGAAGAAAGTVGGVVGGRDDRDCESKTVHKETAKAIPSRFIVRTAHKRKRTWLKGLGHATVRGCPSPKSEPRSLPLPQSAA